MEENRLKLMQVQDEELKHLDDEFFGDVGKSFYDSSVSFNIEHEYSPSTVPHYPKSLSNTIKAADRYGISDRALADVLSNFLVDLEMVTETDTSMVIDRNKIRRHPRKERHEAIIESKGRNLHNIKSLYFDGRIDKHTKMKFDHQGKIQYEIRPEEHIAVIAQPGNVFINHVSPNSGKAIDIAFEIEEVILENGGHNCPGR